MKVTIDLPDMAELPTTCLDCPLVNHGECDDWCVINYEDIGDFAYYQTKPDWCPLREAAHVDS